MVELSFTVLEAEPERYAAVPTLKFRLRIRESSGKPIHAMLLRVQIQIQPRRRRHTPAEQDRLEELFGTPDRWGATLRPLIWTHASLLVPAFESSVDIDLPVACTYDLDVTAAKYFQALDDGEIPLVFLFSGTVFAKSDSGYQVEQIPWDREANWRLPVRTWHELMESHFPGHAWMRLSRQNLDALQRFKARRAYLTWDDAIEALLQGAEQEILR